MRLLVSPSIGLCLLAFTGMTPPAEGQAFTQGQWTWMGGSSSFPAGNTGEGGQPGVYGTLGSPSTGNIPGGRLAASTWTDSSGNFWLFGGNGYDADGNGGLLNDTWEFNPSTNEWTWISGSNILPCGLPENRGCIYYQLPAEGTLGVPAAGNVPGSLDNAASWTDREGNLWLFGGLGMDANANHGDFNALWEFSPSTKQWAWMGGTNTLTCDIQTAICRGTAVFGTLGTPAAENIPGGHDSSATWTDSSGHFWLFGGSYTGDDVDGGYANDLWEFDPATDEWAWMGGSSSFNQPGVYGTLGTPAPGNIPGARSGASTWTDSQGNFWLFGGEGFDANGNVDFLNDLWEYDPATNQWTWISGSSAAPPGCTQSPCIAPGVYGTLRAPAAGNTPGGRYYAASWIDSKGDFWLFGGGGLNFCDDLWEFDPTLNEWAWMGGSSTAGGDSAQPGTYGILGTPAAGNIPGSREQVAAWTQNGGKFWLFGGYGLASSGPQAGSLNDLWEYQSSVLSTATPVFSVAAGTYSAAQIVTISDATAGASIYYTSDGTTPTASSTLYSGAITVAETETLKAIAVDSGFSNSAVASVAYSINVPADFSVTAAPTSLTISSGQSGTITVSVIPQGGFASSISFACSQLPAGVGCTFSPATVTPSGGAVATTSVTVSVSGASADLRHERHPLFPEAALTAAFCCIGWKKRRRLQILLLLALSVVGLGVLTGCGGGSTPRPPITGLVTIAATSGAIEHTTSFTIN
jgi:N-acetylneuraminic acid mutarotase